MSVQLPAIHHIISQLKFVVPGGAITWYLDTIQEFQRVYDGVGGVWGRNAAFGTLTLGLITIVLFIYVLLTPWLKGAEPNYESWRQSGTLSSVIPIMTSTIVVGFLLLIVTLGRWSHLGYIQGFVGATALYTLTFGLLGLIPAPKIKRK